MSITVLSLCVAGWFLYLYGASRTLWERSRFERIKRNHELIRQRADHTRYYLSDIVNEFNTGKRGAITPDELFILQEGLDECYRISVAD